MGIEIVCSMIVAIASLLSASCAYIACKSSNTANDIHIREMLIKVYDSFLNHSNFSGKGEMSQNVNKELLLQELYLNVMEIACGLYLKNKVNKKLFKTIYKIDIKNLYDNSDYKKALNDRSNNYVNINKVYEKWFEK